jgi:phosphatidylglycerol:prolipoprotein diacylglycerol transferase
MFYPIDPVALQIGPLVIRWYALAYIAGLLGGWGIARLLIARPHMWSKGAPLTAPALDDLLVAMALGVILGGRIGYVLFYNFPFYMANPLEAFYIWKGGMSFHGGLTGAALAVLIFCRVKHVPVLPVFDLVALVAPIGLFFGRIANFINGELWGRVSDVSWAIVFPHAGPEPRHPSQLYQAGLEGICLGLLLAIIVWRGGLKRGGLVAGLFGVGYGIARIAGELFRQPDVQISYLWGGLTMGMVLSAPVIVIGLGLVIHAARSRGSID